MIFARGDVLALPACPANRRVICWRGVACSSSRRCKQRRSKPNPSHAHQNSPYLITNRSVSAFSTRVRSLSNSASDCVDPIFINGNVVTVTRENGFGTANPSQELKRQYAEYSISNGMRGTWHLCDRRTAPGP